jgi:hypothetical protein
MPVYYIPKTEVYIIEVEDENGVTQKVIREVNTTRITVFPPDFTMPNISFSIAYELTENPQAALLVTEGTLPEGYYTAKLETEEDFLNAYRAHPTLQKIQVGNTFQPRFPGQPYWDSEL